jgi:hypothetical protein
MSNITKQFIYKIPDDYLSDKFTNGLTGTWTYKGPDIVYLQIDKETGRESGWCLWEPRDLERPCPLNCERIKVDCATDTLLAYICNDSGPEEEASFKSNRKWIPQYEAPEGYRSILKPETFEPRDIYDEYTITYNFDTKTFNIPIKTYETVFPGSSLITWDKIRSTRNKLLEDTDGKISNDMPKELQEKWITYRELLRTLPDKLAEFPPHVVHNMFPSAPAGTVLANS